MSATARQWKISPPRARSASPAPRPFAEAGITYNDVDHLMIYDAFAHLPIYGLEDLGFVPRGAAGRFVAERNTAPAANCRSTPMAAAFPTCIPAVRHVHIAGERAPDARHRPRPDPSARISVCHGVGGMFAASGTIIMSNEAP